MIRDTTPPLAPAVNGTVSPGTALPSYSWTPGGGDGSGWYQYNFDGGTWSAETTATSYTATLLSYGDHYFYVQERDAYGNWSASDYWRYFYYPTWLLPVHASTDVSRTPTLRFGTGSPPPKTTYDIWAGLDPKEGFVRIASGLIAFTWNVREPLPAKTRYYWYYVTIPPIGRPTQSPTYYFTTGL